MMYCTASAHTITSYHPLLRADFNCCDLPSKTNVGLLNSFNTGCHGNFTLALSMVDARTVVIVTYYK